MNKHKKYIYLALATVAMLVSGIMYNFTVFNEAISESLGIATSSTSLVFSRGQVAFFMGGLLLGFLYGKVSFRVSAVITSITMGLGMFLASNATALWQLFVFYSILMNCSAGAVYKNVLAAVVPWFSDQLGVATGIMMMGAGLTAFVFNVPMSNLIAATDWRFAMKVLAGICFICTFIPALLIKEKPKDNTVRSGKEVRRSAGREYTTQEMLKTPVFYIFFVWTVMLLAGCTSVTGNAVALSKSIGLETAKAAMVSTLISLSNAVSRIVYGRIYDKKGRKMAMGISTMFFVIGTVSLHLALLTKSVAVMIIAFINIGFSFGGVPTIASTFILRYFGRKNYASNFGVQGSYSLFSPLFGTTTYSLLYKLTDSFQLSYAQLILYAALSAVMYMIINRTLVTEEKR
ncbi:MAG: MFS transporter [Erysipelotrichaceae bacterium]|nr:MFS transporter [Erysipelotrichaceae bacterium]